MLRIYISYAPADRAYLNTLLKWLQPLKEKYFLRIWHNPVPRPGALLPYQWDAMLDNLEESHVYLFLTSYHSLSAAYIEQEEIPRAVERHVKFGDDLIRVYPVLLSPSQWKKHSGLASYTPLGPPQTLAGLKPDENGYLALVEQLEEIVIALRRNWMEEHRRLGLSARRVFQTSPAPCGNPGTQANTRMGQCGPAFCHFLPDYRLVF